MTDAPTSPPPARVAIYGSCVSRDTLATMDADRYQVTSYIARQSLLSAGWDASAHFPSEFTALNEFQRRNIVTDLRGALLSTLPDPSSTDLLVWDLVDERHGVYVFPDGSVATRSIDLLMVDELVEATKPARHLPFGNDEHFARWSGAASMFVHALATLGWGDRMLVVAVPWALTNDAGDPTPLSYGTSAAEANELYERYYAQLESLGLPVQRVPPDAAIADSEHRWGTAPFHYTPRVYARVRDAIDARLSPPLLAPGTAASCLPVGTPRHPQH